MITPDGLWPGRPRQLLRPLVLSMQNSPSRASLLPPYHGLRVSVELHDLLLRCREPNTRPIPAELGHACLLLRWMDGSMGGACCQGKPSEISPMFLAPELRLQLCNFLLQFLALPFWFGDGSVNHQEIICLPWGTNSVACTAINMICPS